MLRAICSLRLAIVTGGLGQFSGKLGLLKHLRTKASSPSTSHPIFGDSTFPTESPPSAPHQAASSTLPSYSDIYGEASPSFSSDKYDSNWEPPANKGNRCPTAAQILKGYGFGEKKHSSFPTSQELRDQAAELEIGRPAPFLPPSDSPSYSACTEPSVAAPPPALAPHLAAE